MKTISTAAITLIAAIIVSFTLTGRGAQTKTYALVPDTTEVYSVVAAEEDITNYDNCTSLNDDSLSSLNERGVADEQTSLAENSDEPSYEIKNSKKASSRKSITKIEEEATTITTATANVTISPTTAEIDNSVTSKSVEDLVSFVYRFGLYGEGFDSSTAEPKEWICSFVDMKGSVFHETQLFPNSQEINYNDVPDPLNKFSDTSNTEIYYKIPKSDVEWIMINMFNFDEEKVASTDWTGFASNGIDNNWFGIYYYDGNFYYGGYAIFGSEDGLELESYEKQADGSYIVNTSKFDCDDYSEGPTIIASRKIVDGKTIWSITEVY